MRKEPPFISRILQQQDGCNGRIYDNKLDPSQAPIVILGEAGIGKSRLLTQLATKEGWDKVRADEIDLTNDCVSTVWLIDALDETANTTDEALKVVLQELKKSNCPSFIISCRTSDWLHAKHASWIQAAYGKKPKVLHLQPFDDEGIQAFLRVYLDSERIIKLQSHLERFGFTHWLGNPHTLKLIAESAAHDKIPRNRSELFQYAVEQLVSEHNDLKTNNAFALKDALDLAGAVCAALLLTGHTAISLKAKHTRVTDFPLVELEKIPNGNRIKDLLGTRLFRALDNNRFECIHRSIAEYLAAYWLTREPLAGRNQRRLLGMFHQHGTVPSGLRGIHAWMCMSSKLSQSVISMDPAGVIENADLAKLDIESSNLLLERLEECYTINPMALSWWHPGAATELANKGLMEKLVNIGKDRNKPVRLRLFVLESLEAAAELEPFKKLLLDCMHDSTEDYAIRRAALQALFNFLPGGEVLECIHVLYKYADPDSVRLAFDLACLVNFDGVENKLLATLIIGCSYQNERFGELDKFALLKSSFPVPRCPSLLDYLIDQMPQEPFSTEFYTRQDNEFRELLIALTLAAMTAMTANKLSPAQAWRVFRFLYSVPLYTFLDFSITKHLAQDHSFRQAIQQYVMLDCTDDESLTQRYERLLELGLDCSESDIIAMLARLDVDNLKDERWKTLVNLVHHDNEHGVKLRAAALLFAGDHPQRRAWANNIELDFSRQARPELLQHENQRREEQSRHDATAILDEHKTAMAAISLGDHRYLMKPAKTYLHQSRYTNDAEDGYAAIVQWAGDELATAVFQGFENYLLNIQKHLSSEASSQHFGYLRLYERNSQNMAELSAEIILAAAIEHMRTRSSLACLADEALLAIFLSTKQLLFEAPDTLKTLVYKTLSERNLLMEAIKLWFEPSIFSGENIPQVFPDAPELYKQTEKILTTLASNWLECQPDLPEHSLHWCLQHLAFNEPDTLPRALRHWGPENSRPMPLFIEAVQLIVNFEEMSVHLNSNPVNPELLLALSEFQMLTPTVAPTRWIIERFRGLFPMTGWVKGNLHDEGWPRPENEYLQRLIFQLSEQQTDEALSAMNLLCEVPCDSYTDFLCERRALQRQHNKGKAYQQLTLEALLAIKCDEPPLTGADFLAFLLEQLDVVQQRIKNDEINSWKLFYKDDGETPQGEECCRDRLIGMFENIAESIRFVPERRVVDQKRVDIMCETRGITLPIEIKCAWNRQLWSAADQQLDDGYVSFHRGSNLGIYLVLWFGEQSRRPPRPTGGSLIPSTPEQLKAMLEERSEAVKSGRVTVVVMDMTRSLRTK